MTAKVICPHRDAPCRRGCQLGTFCRIGPSREACEAAMHLADAADLPDGAYWMMVHDLLGMEYGDLWPVLEKHGLVEAVTVPVAAPVADSDSDGTDP